MDGVPLQRELAAALEFSSDKDLEFLLYANIYACFVLGESANVTLRLCLKVWLGAFFDLLFGSVIFVLVRVFFLN